MRTDTYTYTDVDMQALTVTQEHFDPDLEETELINGDGNW